MTHVIFISQVLSDAGFSFGSVTFSEAPKIGDGIDILTFLDEITKPKVQEFLDSKNLKKVGIIYKRSWSYPEEGLHLVVALQFDKKDIENNDSSGFFK